MNRGQRIVLIRRLADRMSQEDFPWSDLDLVLRQFGIDTYDLGPFDQMDQRSYAVDRLEAADDATLVELDAHLLGGDSRGLLDPADLPWQAGALRLFVSHVHAQARIAGQIREALTQFSIDAFVAHTTIEPTRRWESVIESALVSCDALVVLATDGFRESAWCDQEVGYALGRNIPIVPVRMGADPHGFIAKFQAATPRRIDSGPWVADAIFRALAGHAALARVMAGPVVTRFAHSQSFEGARSNFALLRRVAPENWTRELVELAESRASENSQIANANVIEPESRPMTEALAELLSPIRSRLGMDDSTDADSSSYADLPF